MKKRIFTTIIAAAMSAMIFLPSCNKDDNEIKLTHKDSAKVLEVLTKSQYAVGGNFSPNNGAKDIYVGTDFSIKPGVALNTPFEVKLADQTVTYRYDLKSCAITDASGADFATGFNYNEQDTLITINSKILNGNTKYTLSSTIALMQQINGEWQPVVYNGATKEYVSTSLFTTCQAADTLRPADILFSYPIDRQLNYMPKEYQEGYIMLSYNYPELFDGVEADNMKVVIKNISDETKAEQTTTFSVKDSREVEHEVVEIDYSLKDIQFDAEQIYSLTFYCGNKQVHQMYFRVSKHSTLKSKMESNAGFFDYSFVDYWYDNIYLIGDYYKLVAYNYTDETFDKFECQTLADYVVQNDFLLNEKPRSETINTCLITMEFDLETCEWYQNSTFKLLYDNYPQIQSRKPHSIKYPPINAFELFSADIANYSLTDEEIQSRTITDRSTRYLMRAYIGDYMMSDWKTRKEYIENGNGHNPKTEIDEAIVNNYPTPGPGWILKMCEGDYPYYVSFRLPGKNIITSKEKHNLKYK